MVSITLHSTLAVKKALDESILESFTTETGIEVDGVFDPTNVLLQRIENGERPDLMIGVSHQLDPLGAVLDLDSRTAIARVGVGIAVDPSCVIPDIHTVDALVVALRSARSVAYSRTGASGVYFARLLEELGIASEVNAQATIVEKGFTALAVIDGRADLAVQQLSELLFVPEATVVGPLPEPVQHYTEFSAAIGAALPDPAPARALLDALSSPRAGRAYAATGLRPVHAMA
ncbi:substrate-binding domain-containing protein [Microbacterium sp. GXF0217]